MCNVTSIVMALDYLGWKFPEGDYKQPEDNLCDFIFRSSEKSADVFLNKCRKYKRVLDKKEA
jgi:hypothetical protein